MGRAQNIKVVDGQSSCGHEVAATTLVGLLSGRADRQPEQVAFLFLSSAEGEQASLTYSELDRRARAIAAHIRTEAATGDRALLLYPPGLDYIAAFFGCLYAGVLAVPTYPPRQRLLSPLSAIIADSGATIALTTHAMQRHVGHLVTRESSARELETLRWMATDGLKINKAPVVPEPEPEAIAFIQYTSGSTAAPKGVMLSHANLLSNSARIQRLLETNPDSRSVSWLPLYHDMGLIGAVLQPLYVGFPATIMSPRTFIQSPIRWLREISAVHATVVAAPNFAYDLCVRATSPQEREGLDLSSCRAAVVGAEPVRAETLDNFAEAFERFGFRRSSFIPAYGLAESTLLVSGGRRHDGPRVLALDAAALGHGLADVTDGGRSTSLVSCGQPIRDHAITIVDPVSLEACADKTVGEIWISGPSVAQGYWNRPEQTEQLFHAQFEDDGPYLRTGDLGFQLDGELFVTGRLKELIIVRGRNHYPQDIESTVQRAHRAVYDSVGAAFSVVRNAQEHVAVVQELPRHATADSGEVIDAIRSAVAEQHGLELHAIALLKAGTIPKTSSGKVRRDSCRQGLLNGKLELVAQWSADARNHHPSVLAASSLTATAAPVPSVVRTENLIHWLRSYAETRINSLLIDERRTIPPHVVLDFGNHGLLGMEVPTRYGGIELRAAESMRVLAQLAAIDLTLALFVGNNNALGVRPILRYGSDELRGELLPLLASGRSLAAFALTEAAAGSNPRAIASTAVSFEPDRWLLRGSKLWIGSASWAGVINVFTQLVADDGSPRGVTGFAVREGTPGLRIGREALTMGMRGMVQNAVELDDVAIGRDSLLGREGSGLEVTQDAMQLGRLGLGAISAGAMKRCAQLMHRYADRRSIATGRLLEHPVSLERFGDVLGAIAAIETMVARSAKLLDAGEAPPAEVLMACKTAGTEHLWQTADALVQMLGGRGYLESNEAARILRDARVFRIFEGPTETLRMFIGASVMHDSRKLDHFLRDVLGVPSVADRLQEAVAAVKDRNMAPGAPFTEPAIAYRRACAHAGVVAEAALLMAFSQAELRSRSSAEIRRAQAWAELRFDDAVAAVERKSKRELVLAADEVGGAIARFEEDIGDVEQTLGDEERSLDELLRKKDTALPGISGARLRTSREQTSYPSSDDSSLCPDPASLSAWISSWLASRVGVPPQMLDPRRPLASFGLDSVLAVELAGVLEKRLSIPVDATLAWEYPTIDALAAYLTRAAASPRKSDRTPS